MSDVGVTVLLTASVVLGAIFYLVWRRFDFRRRASNLDWPEGLTIFSVAKYADYYLKLHGWTPEGWHPPYWAKITWWGRKNGQRLYLFFTDGQLMDPRTQINDAVNSAQALSAIVTVVLYGVRPEMISLLRPHPLLLMIQPKQLAEIDALLTAHVEQSAARQACF